VRESIIHRPLVPAAAGMILGVAAANNWFTALLLLALLALLKDLRSSLICAAAFAIGAILAPNIDRASFPKQFLNANATVISVPKLYREETVAQIRVGDVLLMMGGPPTIEVELGDVIHIRGYAKPLAVGSERLADRGIAGRIWVDSVEKVGAGPWVYHVGNSWRDSFVAFTDRTLPPRVAAAVETVCFNVQARMDEGDRDAFSRAGTVHAISVSGLHVAVLVLVLLGFMSLFPIPRGLQIGLIAAVLLLYSIASGLHAPIIRASMMSILISGAYLLRREPDFLSAIALAVVVQLLWDASAIYDAGFQLTFVALAVIAYFGAREKLAPNSMGGQIKHRLKFGLARTSLVAVGAAPITAYAFGTLSIPSIIANVITVLAIPFIVVFAMGAHFVSYVSASLSTGMMVSVVEPLSGWLLFVTDHLGGDWAAITVPAFSGYWLFLIYGLLILVWRMRLRPA
jgi:ComEC/Rec2-related protein